MALQGRRGRKEQDEEQIKTISSLAEADDGESEFKPSHIYIYLNIYK